MTNRARPAARFRADTVPRWSGATDDTVRVRDDEVFDAIADLVSAGEYLDQIPGRPGVNIEGGGFFKGGGRRSTLQRIYERRSPEFAEAKARGWIDPLPPLQPAPLAAVEEIENLAERPLPPLLRRLYLEVGNGGFGPGYGLLGLRDGHSAGDWNAFTVLGQRRSDKVGGPVCPLLICDWGCGITNELDLDDGQIWGSDPNPAPDGVSDGFPQHITVTEWFAKWLDGRLYQPWLFQDPTTGEWRGATEAEYEAAMAEMD